MSKFSYKNEQDYSQVDKEITEGLSPSYQYGLKVAILEEQTARHKLESDRIAQDEAKKNRRNRILIALIAGDYSPYPNKLPW